MFCDASCESGLYRYVFLRCEAQHRQLDFARWQAEDIALYDALEIRLRQHFGAFRSRRHVGTALWRDRTAVGQAERIESASADRRAAIGRVQQILYLALQHGVVVRLQMIGVVVRAINIPGPALERQRALHANQVLRRVVVLVPGLGRQPDVAAVPGEARVRVGTRRQQGAQIRRDERIGDGDARQRTKLREAATAAGLHLGVHMHELPIHRHAVRELIVELGVDGRAVQRVLNHRLRPDRHAHVAGDERIAIVCRTAIVACACLREQGAVIVEAEIERVAHRPGHPISLQTNC